MILSSLKGSGSIIIASLRESSTIEEACNKLTIQLDREYSHLRDTSIDFVSGSRLCRVYEVHQNAAPSLVPTKLLRPLLLKGLVALGWREPKVVIEV